MSVDLLLRQAARAPYFMDGEVVPRQCARLRERGVAQVASEGAHIHVTPVVNDQARALDKGASTVLHPADEVGRHAVQLLVVHAHLRVGALWH